MLRKDLIKKITKNINYLGDNIISNLSRHIDYEVRVKKNTDLKAKIGILKDMIVMQLKILKDGN
jgi:hypothetical protein